MLNEHRLGAILWLLLASGGLHRDSSDARAGRRPATARRGRATALAPIEPIHAPFPMADLQRPQFPAATFDVRQYGAVADGKTKNTDAFAKAIAAAVHAGGGRVVVPPGRWLTGPIHLESHVNLEVQAGAEILFSQQFADYLPPVFTRWEGMEVYNYSPLIYAHDCTDVAVTGGGKLDGQGSAWWPWKKKQQAAAKRLYEMVLAGTPVKDRVFGTEAAALRPSFIQTVGCKNVLIEGVTVTNGPMWTLHPVYSENVIIRGVNVVTERRQQRRLRPRFEQERADRGLVLQHRRRLHHHQVRAQRGRLARRQAEREHRRAARARRAGPRRRRHRQRDVGRRAQRLGARLRVQGHRPRPAHQIDARSRRRDRERLVRARAPRGHPHDGGRADDVLRLVDAGAAHADAADDPQRPRPRHHRGRRPEGDRHHRPARDSRSRTSPSTTSTSSSEHGVRCVDAQNIRFDGMHIAAQESPPFSLENVKHVSLNKSCGGAIDTCVALVGSNQGVTFDGAGHGRRRGAGARARCRRSSRRVERRQPPSPAVVAGRARASRSSVSSLSESSAIRVSRISSVQP